MIKTIAIDDEPLALKLLCDYIQKTPFLELIQSFDNPVSCLEFLEDHPVDLIFLDIQMPDLSGTEFAKKINQGPKLVFTTAFEKYAVEGFKLDAIDYLLKPFEYEEFLKAATKAKKILELEDKALSLSSSNTEFLFLKSDYKVKRINFEEILYIEGLKDYVKIFIKNEPKPVFTINSLKTLESKLPADRFMRVHRSFIVNLKYVSTIERSRIVFDKVYIPISEQYKEKFQEFISKNFL